MAPNAETEATITMTSDFSKIHSLKAAIFHTMAFKLSLEINKNKVTPKSLIAFLKVLYNVTQIKKKKVTFDQYSRIHLEGPKMAICETASNVVFVLNFSFTTNDHYSHTALQEATDTFNNMLQDFGYTQKLELFITRFNTKLIHRNNNLYCHKQHTYILSLFKYISSPLLHPSSMMPRDVVVDHSSKGLLLQR